jgi:hypothetical protein
MLVHLDLIASRTRNQELRQRILALPGVTEKQNAGIHEDAFFVASKMFMRHSLVVGRSGARSRRRQSASASLGTERRVCHIQSP